MPAETWGLMAKSEVDPEKIEEAIDRLIEEHNDDPEAHLAAGQSLQSHKAEEIIDHIIGSVKADKFSATEDICEFAFESLDAYDQDGGVIKDSALAVRLYADYGDVAYAYLSGQIPDPGNWINYGMNMLFQISAWVVDENLGNYEAHMYLLGDYGTKIGFRIINGELRGVWSETGNENLTDPIVVDISELHIYRVLYDPVTGDMRFYIDGVLKATIADISPSTPTTSDFEFGMIANSAGYGDLVLRKFILARQA